MTAPGFRVALWIGAAGLAAWPFVFASSYDHRVFTLAGVYALLVIGYQFIFGRIGALSLTQGAFFGLGAYVSGIMSTRFGWDFFGTFPLSIAVPAILAAIIAVPVLRLETHFFALATLGIAQVLLLVCLAAETLTGGANGLSGIPPVKMLGAEIGRGLPMLALVWGLVAAGGLLAWLMQRGMYGRAVHLMRVNETAARAIGIDTARLRFDALVLSAAYAGAAGALFVHTNRVVSPEVLEFPVMVACLAMAVVGGRGRIAGAILAAVLLVHLPEWFRFLDAWYLLAYGALLLAAIVLAPEGIVGLLERRFSSGIAPAAPAPRPLPARERVSGGDALLDIRDVAKSFGGVRALHQVSLRLKRGEVLGLIGPNGSGKTTLLNIVSGIVAADSGDIRLAESSLTGVREHEIARLGLARSFQNVNLAPDLSLLDNVAVARRGAESSLETARGQAMHLLSSLGLGDVALRPAGDLPLGTQRLAELARALALQPAAILLDEPAAGLSEADQENLARCLRDLRQGGLTLLVVEHNVPFLTGIADRLICLDGGRVIAEGTPEMVCRDARVIEAYLGRPR